MMMIMIMIKNIFCFTNVMNGCETIYKIIKYAHKNKTPQYIDNINAENLQELYHGLKSLYIRNEHVGGSNFVEKIFVHVIRHGLINTEKTLTIPSNVNVIIPFCCGMLHNLGETYDFFNKEVSEKIKIIEESGDVLTIRDRKHIILRPGDTYCDINMNMTLDIELGERISINDDNNHKYDYNNITNFSLKPEIIDKFKIIGEYMKRNARYLRENKLQIPLHTETIYEEYMPFKYINAFVYRLYHKQLFTLLMDNNYNMLSEDVNEINSIAPFTENNIDEILVKLSSHNIPLSININCQEIYDTIIDELKLAVETTSGNFLQLIEQGVMEIDQDYDNFIQYNNEKKFFYKDELNEEKIVKHHGVFSRIWSKLFSIGQMNTIELQFIDEVVSSQNTLSLQTHIDFLSSKFPDKKIYIFSTSCQGFGSNKVCNSYKCLQLLDKHFDRRQLETREIFSQEDFLKINETMKYIEHHNLYNTMLIEDELYDAYHKIICAFHGINIKNPIMMAKYFVIYTHNSYKPLYDYIMTFTKSTFFPIDVWKRHMQFIKTILNLCITDIYHETTIEHQAEIKKMIN